jgi:hypothetical protein
LNGRTVCTAALCMVVLCAAAIPSHAINKGLAKGKVGLITTSDRAYGYSATTGHWSWHGLQGRVVETAVCDYLGLIIGTEKITAYNAIADLWVDAAYSGVPQEYAVGGAVIVFRTNDTCYGISTMNGSWHVEPFAMIGNRGGCASAGNFGLVWGDHKACAFNGATGMWYAVETEDPVIGGLARAGMGLVWTRDTAYAYRATPSQWISLEIEDAQGICVTGEGSVGLVWNGETACAFSGQLGTWTQLSEAEVVNGGTANGDVVIVWNDENVFGFNAEAGVWTSIQVDGDGKFAPPMLGVGATIEGPSAFAISPNPSQSSALTFELPGDLPWHIEVFDVEGRCVRSLEVAGSSGGSRYAWDGRTDAGIELVSGTYWARGQSGDQTEARRFVLLP